MQKQPTIFFGAASFVLPVIEFLQETYDLKLVVTTEKKNTDAVPTYCKQHSIPYIVVNTKQDLLAISEKLQSIQASFAVLANFGVIIQQTTIAIFPKGIVNIHPSLLPLYRGTTPAQTALILGAAITGVSIMLLDEKWDQGPILGQEKEVILANDTALTLYNRLFAKGSAVLEAVLPAYLSGELQPIEQDHTKATYTKMLTRGSGYIDSNKETSPVLFDRTIRAYYPWPGVWTKWQMKNGKEKIVKFLPNKIIQVEGKKSMSYKDFMNGYPEGRKFLEKLQLI